METINEELIMSFLEDEETCVENHININEEEEEKLNRVIRSLEVEINMSSTTIESRKIMDMQHTKSCHDQEDDFGWLNDFDDIGHVVSSQNDDDDDDDEIMMMMNWCTELSYIDDVNISSVLDIDYGLTFEEEPNLSLWQDNINELLMY
ncbi:unnamed protein product [Cochlearia groenlandica]